MQQISFAIFHADSNAKNKKCYIMAELELELSLEAFAKRMDKELNYTALLFAGERCGDLMFIYDKGKGLTTVRFSSR